MADEREGSADSPLPGGGRRKRPMPTIDLAPNEIGPAPAEPPSESARAAAAGLMQAVERAASSEQPPQEVKEAAVAEPPIETGNAVEPAASGQPLQPEAREGDTAEAAVPEQPSEPEIGEREVTETAAAEQPSEPETGEREATETAAAKEASQSEQPEEREEPAEPRGTVYERTPEPDLLRWIPNVEPPNVPWASLGAGAAGAVIMLLGLWLVGILSDDDGARVVENRVLRMESQLRDLARAQGQQTAADPRRFEELIARVGRLESAPAPILPPAAGPPQRDPVIGSRLDTAEEIIKALDQSITDLHRRGDEINAGLREARERADADRAALADLTRRTAQQGTTERSEVEAINRRIATAESALRGMQAELAKLAAGSPDRAARLAAAASGLRAAVERGDPFTAELAAVKALGADAGLIAPLEPFASSGVPSAASLGRDFAAVSAELQRSAGATTSQGASFLDRLQANAEKLVRVRPIDEAPGDDPRAIIARAEARAARGDLAAAVAEIAKLPAADRAAADSWVRKVEARAAALDASSRLASGALAAFARSP